MSKELGIDEIKQIIPHRFPMLLIDRVLFLKVGQEAKAVHNVSFGESFVQASSSKDPVFSSILIVEAMAQTGAVALLSKADFAGKTAYFGGIKEANFIVQARPGDQIVLTTKLTKIRKNIGIGIGEAWVGNKKIAQAELTFMIG
ncbi:3-hydroxyacyl-ACP dehydratase FabZ [Lactobacillus crispatus]|uniref:3-hydroxyacyl-ACP dehydratase FabZ n=1 Tax=Lactobacillus crispatus TaxID=47770 RepID=UPI003F1F477E